MQCKFCGFGNGEDDHRCLRCGRRVAGTAVEAPTGYTGALALSAKFDSNKFDPNRTQDLTASGFFPPLKSEAESRAEARAKELAEARLGIMRGPGRLIQFDQYQKQSEDRAVAPAPAAENLQPEPIVAEAAAASAVAQGAQRPMSMAELRAWIMFIAGMG